MTQLRMVKLRLNFYYIYIYRINYYYYYFGTSHTHVILERREYRKGIEQWRLYTLNHCYKNSDLKLLWLECICFAKKISANLLFLNSLVKNMMNWWLQIFMVGSRLTSLEPIDVIKNKNKNKNCYNEFYFLTFSILYNCCVFER